MNKKELSKLIKEAVAEVLSEQQQLPLPGIGDLDRKIVSYYEKWTPEDVEHGETWDKGEHDEYEIELDDFDREEGLTPVDLAVEYLKDNYVVHASSSHFHPGIWYTAQDDEDFRTGDRTVVTYHLKGFTEEEERDIYDALKADRRV